MYIREKVTKYILLSIYVHTCVDDNVSNCIIISLTLFENSTNRYYHQHRYDTYIYLYMDNVICLSFLTLQSSSISI